MNRFSTFEHLPGIQRLCTLIRMNTRINTGLIITLLAVTLFGAGCVGQIGDPTPGQAEQQTPLGCNKSKARYFDPKTGTCVKATSQQQAYILNEYRYLAEYAQKDEKGLTREFQISLARDFTPDELFKLMEALPEAKVSLIGMQFPGYKLPRTITPRFKTPVSVSEAPAAAVKDTEALNGKADPFLEQETAKKNYTVWDMRVIDTADHLLTWWTNHLTDITVVEPRVNELDKIKSGIWPSEVEH